MVKRHALIESLSSNLHDFAKQNGKDLSLPEKKSCETAVLKQFEEEQSDNFDVTIFDYDAEGIGSKVTVFFAFSASRQSLRRCCRAG